MISVAAEKIFTIGSFPITNSILSGWIVLGIFLILGFSLRTLKKIPTGIQNAFEALIEFMLDFMDQVTHDRERSKRFLPFVGTLFLFILLANWMGLVPGVGSIVTRQLVGEETENIPLFRAATSDLNMTLAIGLLSVVVSHIFGIMTIGFFKYWNKFIQLGTLANAIKAFARVRIEQAFIGLFTAIVEFMVGIIELVSEVAKVVSLSLRLFGNIFAGEVLLTVLASLIAFFLPLPFMALELIVGVIQALVFSMLTLVYLTIATEQPHGKAAEAH